jgi:hypothetical protein
MNEPAANVVVEYYGMHMCGFNSHGYFYSPVRNWTRYNYTGITGFIDDGAE